MTLMIEPPRKLQLYDDQQRALTALEAELDVGGSPLLRMPTGAGKTEVVAGLVVQRRVHRVLFLVPGRVLLDQTRERFQGYGVSSRSSWPPRTDWPRGTRVMVVTPITAANRFEAGLMPADLDLVVIDEAHHCYTAVGKADSVLVSLVNDLKASGAGVVGMSATPWSLNDRARFDSIFTRLVEADDYLDLVEKGRLSPLELMVPADGRQVEAGAMDSTGEYTARGIADANEDESVYTGRAVDLLRTFQDADPLDWRKTIVYAISVGHAVNLANLLASEGVPTGLVISRAPNADEDEVSPEVDDDRDSAVSQFQDGALRCLVNYAIVKEGFDSGDAEVIMVTRPTASKALYRQMTGRGSRVSPGKAQGYVIDLTSNYLRHGPPMSADRYSLLPRIEWEGGGGDPPVIECEPWPEPESKAVGDLEVQPWCGWLKSWRTRICPTCSGVQGDVCKRCGRFRRWGKYGIRKRKPAGERGNTCVDCREEEREVWRAEQMRLEASEQPGGTANWLYRHMTRTQKSWEGETSAGSRYTTIKDRGLCGVDHKTTGNGWSRWRPYLRVDDTWIDLRPTESRWAALTALYDAIDERGLLPLVEMKNRKYARKRKERRT